MSVNAKGLDQAEALGAQQRRNPDEGAVVGEVNAEPDDAQGDGLATLTRCPNRVDLSGAGALLCAVRGGVLSLHWLILGLREEGGDASKRSTMSRA